MGREFEIKNIRPVDEKAKIKRQHNKELRAKRIAAREKAKVEEEKLYLPCPFCGSRKIVWLPQIPEWCQCKGCGATGPQGKDGQSKAKAIMDWNRRTK